MNEIEFNQHIREKARRVADYLSTLTPYERALVLDAAQSIWEERRTATLTEQLAEDAREDALTMITEWLGQVVRRLSPESVVSLVQMFKEIDEDARWERIMQDLPERHENNDPSVN
jgi:hypothetical protein